MLVAAAVQLWCGGRVLHAESPKMSGNWMVDITFENGDTRSLRFDVKDAGKGSFLLAGPAASSWGPAGPWEAKWTQGVDGLVTISGKVEFPLGNVGRDEGILELKGKFETEGSLKGTVGFSPTVGDGPSKSGTFKAIRAPAG